MGDPCDLFSPEKLNFSVIPAPQILFNSIKFSVFFTDGRCGELVFLIQAVGWGGGGSNSREDMHTRESAR